MSGPAVARRAARNDVRPAVVTVASVPAGHVHVRHLSDPVEHGRVERLPDPRPCPAPDDPSVWWPPVMLDPSWVEENHRSFDVFHLHFGFDARPVEDLRALVTALRRAGVPLVQTVHDLRNPHHPRRDEHDRRLDVLIPAADELVTLTRGAADEIARRWGYAATVLPHPHVVDLPSIDTPEGRARRDRRRHPPEEPARQRGRAARGGSGSRSGRRSGRRGAAPVAGFAVGALPEIVDDTCGRLVPAGDVDALAAAIPTVERLSRGAARRRAELRWSHRRMVDEYEALYRRVAA